MGKKLRNFFSPMRGIPAWCVVLFCLSCTLMNLLANKSIDTGNLDWLALDCGIAVSWAAFFSMDVIVKGFGAKASIVVSIFAIMANIFVSVIFFAVAQIPGNWGESFGPIGQAANISLDNTLSGNWYILLGSVIATLVSSVTNSLLNSAIGSLFNRHDTFSEYAARSYISTLIGQFADNLTFSLIVSISLFGWSLVQCFACAATGALVELLCEALFSPIGYKVTRIWARDGIGHLQ